MEKMKYIIYVLLAVFGLTGCGESLEETYSDYAGDGRIRYVGRCSELNIVPGWKRLQLTWLNSNDLIVKNIKVTWTVNEVTADTLLDAGADSLDLKNLVDGNYRIDIRGVDVNGNESFPVTNYARPYTENHEVVRTFTGAITKYFRVGDNMAFFTDRWNDNIVEIRLEYTDKQGKQQMLPLDEGLMTEGFHVIKDINTNEQIILHREGKLEACPDTIRFESRVLNNEKSFASDFLQELEVRYGVSSNKDMEEFNQFIDTVRVLEFDYDMTSFEDVLNCPHLEKIVLGKNRYLYPDPVYSRAEENSKLFDLERSLTALQAANELMGLQVELYGNHYFEGNIPKYVIRKGDYSLLPDDFNYITTAKVDSITSSIMDIDANAMLMNLVDNDPETQWRSSPEPDEIRSYDLTIYLKEVMTIRGIKISQVLFPLSDTDSPNFLPARLIVKTSEDGRLWKDVTFVEENRLGKGSGEVTLLPVSEGEREVKFIRVSLHDEGSGTYRSVKLGDIVPYY